ncbi:MAG TPA: hypothetical protein VF282_10730 [Bacillota bacterium]
MVSWLLGLLTLLGIAGLVAGLFGLRTRGAGRTGSYRWLLGFSVLLLAATAYFGWPGPFGAPGTPLGQGPDVPRSELGRLDPAEIALDAVGPSNRGADPRVQVVRDVATARPDRIRLLLRANDARDMEALKAQIRRDNWTILHTLYTDSRFDRLQEIEILTTHPTGRGPSLDAGTGPPGGTEEAGGEPVVAEVRLTRSRFDGVSDPARRDRTDLERIAEVRWLPPLR